MRAVSLLLTLGLLGLAGCVTAPAVTIAPATTLRPTEPAVEVVRATQVTPQSAEKVCQNLGDEIDRDMQQLIGTAVQKR